MHTYRQYRPSPPLAVYIECYWAFQSQFQTHERLIPGGRVELIINLGDPVNWLVGSGAMVHDTPWLMGQRNKIFYAHPTGRTHMLGVRFKPGGIGAFTKVPTAELLNSMVPADLILGKEIKNWPQIIQNQTDDQVRLETLNQLMSTALHQQPAEWQRLQTTLNSIRQHPAQPSIQQLGQEVNWGYRRLERNFHQSIGYSPKHYHKIVRFNRAIRLMHTQPATSLTSIGYECGYFDQSHFIKDFQQFTGTTPKRFLNEINPIADLLIRHQPV